ncbi:hypothetical protein [Pseudomonas gingeri]|uniref:Lipoprotein n=1 Tax=Pseudomonas gingeri TaxID=117681 RepID=A0A7Y7YCS7_9PSED|nr:hypothetical protein [Pseudomonas gingeri]NWA02400.1 hypothetical protein [Pseudomonas gingeri]NWA12427.1 hypothetical protein [Pseudomonas gingeri]NWA57167.1 hypothetical protein [Pseudomonas gingeri]NWA93510.1 hypothetical protein [Pseudomonas gingeri]NWB02982.1 hypothetical protein [Pseudomonas gingeri]
MRMLIGALATVALAGCMSPGMNQTRTTGPTKTFTSAKADNVVAQCIQFSWQDEAVFDVDAAAYLQPGYKGGSTVYTRGSEYFVDVRRDANGTVVDYYATTSKPIGARRLAAVATCL